MVDPGEGSRRPRKSYLRNESSTETWAGRARLARSCRSRSCALPAMPGIPAARAVGSSTANAAAVATFGKMNLRRPLLFFPLCASNAGARSSLVAWALRSGVARDRATGHRGGPHGLAWVSGRGRAACAPSSPPAAQTPAAGRPRRRARPLDVGSFQPPVRGPGASRGLRAPGEWRWRDRQLSPLLSLLFLSRPPAAGAPHPR